MQQRPQFWITSGGLVPSDRVQQGCVGERLMAKEVPKRGQHRRNIREYRRYASGVRTQ
jgi:hypothetical protein